MGFAINLIWYNFRYPEDYRPILHSNPTSDRYACFHEDSHHTAWDKTVTIYYYSTL